MGNKNINNILLSPANDESKETTYRSHIAYPAYPRIKVRTNNIISPLDMLSVRLNISPVIPSRQRYTPFVLVKIETSFIQQQFELEE